MTYTGDVLIKETQGDFDATWENGQPEMTDGFETAVLLSVFGDRHTWQNGIANRPEERYTSTFPEVVANAGVTEATKNNGVEAIKSALAWMVSVRAAKSIEVEGRILSVYAIGWEIRITRPDGTSSRYAVNWSEGIAVFIDRQAVGVASRKTVLIHVGLETATGEAITTATGEEITVEKLRDWRYV